MDWVVRPSCIKAINPLIGFLKVKTPQHHQGMSQPYRVAYFSKPYSGRGHIACWCSSLSRTRCEPCRCTKRKYLFLRASDSPLSKACKTGFNSSHSLRMYHPVIFFLWPCDALEANCKDGHVIKAGPLFHGLSSAFVKTVCPRPPLDVTDEWTGRDALPSGVNSDSHQPNLIHLGPPQKLLRLLQQEARRSYIGR